MSNDTREALAAKCKDLADTLYTGPVAHKAACVRLAHAAIDELAALTEQPAAPQLSHFGDSVERCGEPSGAVSGGSGIATEAAELDGLRRLIHSLAREARSCRAYPEIDIDGTERAAVELLNSALDREAQAARTDTGASVAGPKARPDQQSDSSSAAPQGGQAESPQGCDALIEQIEDRLGHGVANWADLPISDLVNAIRATLAPTPAQEPQQPARWTPEEIAAGKVRPAPLTQEEHDAAMERICDALDEYDAEREQAARQSEAVAELVEALRDMLAGWKYIRSFHGDLYGVGWDRAQEKAEAALAKHGQTPGGQ